MAVSSPAGALQERGWRGRPGLPGYQPTREGLGEGAVNNAVWLLGGIGG